jgi:hypothetical protein
MAHHVSQLLLPPFHFQTYQPSIAGYHSAVKLFHYDVSSGTCFQQEAELGRAGEMKLIHLRVRNFRGIQSLDWRIDRRVNCLVGPGDSTKTTVLDALELVLSPRWNVLFGDADFFDCDYNQEILIRAVISEFPKALLNEEKFGLCQLAWDESGQQLKELEEGDVPVLAVQLKVGPSLEPEWSVIVSERDPRYISSKDREAFGITRLGEFVDRHITWARGSALARMSEGTQSIREVLAEAQRQATHAVRDLKGTSLHECATKIEGFGKELGVNPRSTYGPGLDTRSLGEGTSFLSLHDGLVPLRMCGLGTRRLLAAAIQRQGQSESGAVIIDEIEHGLEPHRLIHLLRTLLAAEDKEKGPQLFITTHSPTVIAEIGGDGICVVRSDGANTRVVPLPSDDEFKGLVRAKPESLLARRVIVCEGPTEGGLLWALDELLRFNEKPSFGLLGVVASDGGGNTKGPALAVRLASLGYTVCFFGDSDEPPNPDQTMMTAANVKVLLWEGEMCTEERLLSDVPIHLLQPIYDLACEHYGDESCRSCVRGSLGADGTSFDGNVSAWLKAHDETQLRAALGKAAKGSKSRAGWFKRWDKAWELGALLFRHVGELIGTPTNNLVDSICTWIGEE